LSSSTRFKKIIIAAYKIELHNNRIKSRFIETLRQTFIDFFTNNKTSFINNKKRFMEAVKIEVLLCVLRFSFFRPSCFWFSLDQVLASLFANISFPSSPTPLPPPSTFVVEIFLIRKIYRLE
jgi:hypothetical protein